MSFKMARIDKDVHISDGAYYNLKLDTIAKNSIYSTDEITVGAWVNGKPLYRKVIVGNTPSTAGTWTTIGNIPNAEEMVTIKGMIGGYFPVPSYISNDYMCVLQNNGNNIQCNVGNGFLSASIKVIVEYTKTTD